MHTQLFSSPDAYIHAEHPIAAVLIELLGKKQCCEEWLTRPTTKGYTREIQFATEVCNAMVVICRDT